MNRRKNTRTAWIAGVICFVFAALLILGLALAYAEQSRTLVLDFNCGQGAQARAASVWNAVDEKAQKNKPLATSNQAPAGPTLQVRANIDQEQGIQTELVCALPSGFTWRGQAKLSPMAGTVHITCLPPPPNQRVKQNMLTECIWK